MKPESHEHATQRKLIADLLDANGLAAHRDAVLALVKPGIGLRTRAAREADLAVGASRVGGEPDLPKDVDWPAGEEGPLLFVLQVRLADVTRFDLEELLPPDGMLSVFSDRFADDVRVIYTPEGTPLAHRAWAPEEDGPFTACGVDVLPELHLPPHSSAFVGVAAAASTPGSAARMGSTLALPQAEYENYWDNVWLVWRAKQRAGSAGEAGIHQLLGYAVGDDTGEQGHDDEVLVGFDSDDRAKMEWGDVQCIWALIPRAALLARKFDALRATT